jgi:predicted HTH domain antitoxin
MSVNIPDDLLEAARLTESEVLQELALTLFQQERLTLAQSSRLARMDRMAFQHLLASRRIPIHYDVPELEADLQTLRDMGRL